MKVRKAAATSFAAILSTSLAFTTVAQAQYQTYQPGLGYGGNAPCGYAQTPAPGATSAEDAYADLLADRKAIKARMDKRRHTLEVGSKSLDRQKDDAKDEIQSDFQPKWAGVFLQHMDRRMNCDICGSTLPPLAPTQPQTPASTQSPTPAVVKDNTDVVPVAPVYRNPPARPVPPRSVAPGDNNPDELFKNALKQCLKAHPDWLNEQKNPRFNRLIRLNTRDAQAKIEAFCAEGRSGVSNAELSQDRLMASDNLPIGGGRAPAGETGTNGGSAPVSSGSDVPRSDDDFFKNIDYGAGAGGNGRGSLATCYAPTDGRVYQSEIWQNRICMMGGHLDANICRTRGITSGNVNYDKCHSAVEKYLALLIQIEQLQKENAGDKSELDDVEQKIADWKTDHSDGKMSEDDRILAARDARNSSSQSGSVRSGPSFSQALLSTGLGLAAGGLTYGLIHSSERSAWNKSNDQNLAQQSALGWPGVTVPYQDSGASVVAGLGVFQGVTGGLMGSFGCGQTNGGVNGNIFGNPYAQQNPYALQGGAMYNPGGGPWGMAGPWGNGAGGYYGPGAGIGGQIGIGAGGGSPYGIGQGGYYGPGAGIGGQFGIGAGGGSPYGLGQSGYPYGIGGGAGGQFGIGGGSGYPYGVGGGLGNQFGIGGGGSPYGVGGGYSGGYGYQQAQVRNQANQYGLNMQANELYSTISGAQQQLQLLQPNTGNYYSSSPYSSSYSPYSSYAGYSPYSTGIGASFNLSGGVGSGYGYQNPAALYNSLYSPYSYNSLFDESVGTDAANRGLDKHSLIKEDITPVRDEKGFREEAFFF